MRIPFRQGVFIFQQDSSLTPIHIRKNPDALYLDVAISPKSIIGSICDGTSNYLFSEVVSVSRAWGPFTPNTTQYFYWDIDKLTGELTRGITNFEPIYSPHAPLTPQVDQHWFDKSTSKMKVWTGIKWQDKLRLFAGFYQSSGSVNLFVNSTTAGPEYVSESDAGYILRDYDGRPIRLSSGEFLTTDTDIKVSAYLSQAVTKPSPQFLDVSAAEYIPRFSIVALSAPNKIVLASSNPLDYKKPVGIVTVDLIPGEVTSMIFEGVVINPLWNFSNDVLGEPLFCDPTGKLTLSRPITEISFRVGTVLGPNIVRVLIEDDLTGLVQRTATFVVRYLEDLLDVTATVSPSDQQVLSFSTDTNKWQPLTLSKTEYLDQLLDVTATSVAIDQQVLTFSSSTNKWQPASVPRVEYLEQLLDVTGTVSPLDQQVLSFSTLTGQWQPETIPRVEYLDQLLDVTGTNTALDQQVLTFSSSTNQWEPQTVPRTEYLNDLLDVSINSTTLEDGGALVYDGSSWTNKTIDFYDIAMFIESTPTTNTTLLSFIAPRPFTFLPNFANSHAVALSASTSTYVLNIKKNFGPIGYVTFEGSITNGTITSEVDSDGTLLSFNSGDILTVHSSDNRDSSIRDIAITLIAKTLL